MKKRWTLLVALLAAFVLHQDLWFWNDARIVLGLPVGLLYHLLYCFGVSGLMFVLVRFYWPKEASSGGRDEETKR